VVVGPVDWPAPETSHDEDLLTAATVLFLQPARAGSAKRALRGALGGEKFEMLIGFLTFVRSAHYWTLMHPELAFEDDLKTLLGQHEQLAELLLNDSEAGRGDIAERLFDELVSLREFDKQEELESAKRALEDSLRQKDLLMQEVDHRIKNSLQIVSSLLRMHANAGGAAADQFHDAAARVSAIAAVHQQLHDSADVGAVSLDQYLIDLCRDINLATSSSDQVWKLAVDAAPLVVRTELAMPLGLIVNELITNAIRHSRPSNEGGRVQIVLKATSDSFSVSVTDEGNGPALHSNTQNSRIGARIIEAFVHQIDGAITKERHATGYSVTVTVPNRTQPALN
jgi:two-component sensor histidine kinase